jgi:hypothetical protein
MTTLRKRFSEEKLPARAVITLRRIWPAEQSPQTIEAPDTCGKILRPKGELSRLKRGGYSLKGSLGWDDEFYEKVQVISSILLRSLYSINPEACF